MTIIIAACNGGGGPNPVDAFLGVNKPKKAEPKLSFSGDTFHERASDGGVIEETLTITLAQDTFSGADGDNLVASGKVVIGNLPAGLVPFVTRVSGTELSFHFGGAATSHISSNNVSNLSIRFVDGAFNNSLAADVENYSKTNLKIEFNALQLIYNASSFIEAPVNNGTIGNSIDITITGDSYTGFIGEDFLAASKVSVNNLPPGISASMIKTAVNKITFSLLGTAVAHRDVNDINNVTVLFQDSAFENNPAANIDGFLKSNIGVNFLEPATLTWSSLNFVESSNNNGTIGNQITITVANDQFNGPNGENFVSSGKVNITNLPAGLTAVATKTASDTIVLSLTGAAASHLNANDISNLRATFNISAFVFNTDINLVENYDQTTIGINFYDPAILNYSAGSVTESVQNIGAITQTITITLTNDTFTGSLGENFFSSGKASVANIPLGLFATLIKTGTTTVVLSFIANAVNHANINDVNNLTIDFAAGSFAFNTNTATITNANKSDFIVNFLDPYTLSYSTSIFSESLLNNGTISTTPTLTLVGTTLTGNNGDDFIAQGYATIQNLPAGLSATITRTSATTLTMALSGAASNHINSNDISNLTVNFLNSSFASGEAAGVSGALKNNLQVNYDDPASLSYSSGTFNEAVANIGGISNSLTLTLAGDTFTGINGDNFVAGGKISVTNVPAGLTVVATRASATTMTVSLSGNASNHASADDISNLQLTFQNSAFSNNAAANQVINYNKNDLSIDFNNPYTLTYSAAQFNEGSANNGSITDLLALTLTGTTFTGTNGEDLVVAGKVNVTNVPAGLTAVVTRVSNTQVNFGLTGSATGHADIHDIANLTVNFLNSAFSSNAAAGVTNTSRSDLIVNFEDPPVLTYLSGGFTENVANVGATGGIISITLLNKKFNGSFAEDFVSAGKVVFSNVPTGLTPVVSYISDTLLSFSFSGGALNNDNIHDVANITATFQNSAFIGGNATLVTNYQKSNLTFDFNDDYTLTYSINSFDEGGPNDGSIGSTITLTLGGTTFTGSNGDNFVATSKVSASNLPAGLTLVATRNNSTQITLSLTGNAFSHANSNDVSNVSISFNNNAFASAAAGGVDEAVKTGLTVNFNDPAVLTYSSSAFTESVANIGGISNSLSINLANDTFTGSNGENYLGTGKASISNLPLGLSATVVKNSATQVTLALSGQASAHANINDISNLTLTFDETAFTLATNATTVVNYIKNDILIDYNDLYTLTYASSTLTEAAANNGSIGNTLTITLAGTTFTGVASEDLVASSKVNVTNLPAGLSAVVTRDGPNTATVSITGNASNHQSANDINNLTLEFLDSAFNSGAKLGVSGYLKSNVAIDFNDSPFLTYSATSFNESLANIGGISNAISITLAADTFTGSNGDDFVAAGKILVTNLPAGLTAVVTRSSASQLSATLTGQATNHANANDVSNLTFTFQNSAFSNVAAGLISNYLKNDLAIDYIDPYSISYSIGTFTEHTNNDGTIQNTITATLAGTTFTGTNGDNFVAGGKVTIANLPAGLTAVATRTSATQVTLSLTGSATAHAIAQNISNLSFIFENASFNSGQKLGVSNYEKNDFNINYRDPVSIAYSDITFNEAITNIGTITETKTLTITNDTYTGTNGEDFIATGKVTASNVPAGMTATLLRDSSTQLTLRLNGTATNHANANDISNLTINFTLSSFTSSTSLAQITGSSRNDLSVDYVDPYTLAYNSTTFSESLANNGSIGNSLIITVAGTTFTGSNGDNFIVSSKVSISNTPAGLTAIATRTSSTTIEISLTGNAASHTNVNNISNFTIQFLDTAFASGEADGVTNTLRNNIVIEFDPPPTLTYSTSTLAEAITNIGQISATMTITLAGDTFTGANGSNFVAGGKINVTNIPAGLTAVVNKDSTSQLTLSLTGSATNHENAHDISNLSLEFQNSAFTNTAAASLVTNYQKTNTAIDFIDAYNISYSTGTFIENTNNNGSIATTITLTLSGTTFSGSNGENYVASSKATVNNVPAGLTAVVTKSSNTQLAFTLSGNATNHIDANDIVNLEIVLEDSAFTSNENAGVLNSTKSDIVVDYRAPVSITYSAGILNEAAANIGTITETLLLTISNDTFTGANGENYVATGKVAISNIPSGFTASMVKNSATQLTLALTGSAGSHANANDISNLTVNFDLSAFTVSTLLATIGNGTRNDLLVNFLDAYTLAYSTSTLFESSTNDGSIGSTIVITLTGTTFTGSNGDNFIGVSKVNLLNLPAGLTATLNRDSATQLTFVVSGNATNHTNAADIANLTFDFADSAFTSNEDDGVVGSLKNNVAVDFNDPPVLAYASTQFDEAVANIGAMNNTITINLTGDTFTGTNGDNFVAGGKVTISNLPAGLTASMVRNSATQAILTLSGSATNHENVNDVANLSVVFQNSAFSTVGSASLVTNYSLSNLIVNFLDAYSLAYSGSSFTESTANDGSVPGSVTITLTGTTFTGANGSNMVSDGKINVNNLSAGLTAVVTKTSNSQATLTITGTATNHENVNDVANLTLSFQDSAFTSGESDGVLASTKNDFILDYRDAVTIAYSAATFNETVANLGATSTVLTLTISNDTFTGSNGEDYIATGKASASNVPSGMSSTLVKISATQLQLSLNGNATNNENANDIANLTISFALGAFTTSSSLPQIVNGTKNDLIINFIDAYSLAYSTSNFIESIGNNGSIATAIVITLTGTTFTGSNGDNFVAASKVAATNVPAGLTAVVTRDSTTQLTITLTGNATAHENANDIANLTLDFADSAFTSNEDAGVLNSIKSNFVVDYRDRPYIDISATGYSETIANIGATSTTRTLTLTGDNFTGANGSDFVAAGKISPSNVPAGLTMVVTKDSNTQLTISFTGNATNHENANDVSNIQLTFQNSAFNDTSSASLVLGYVQSGMSMDFIDTYTLSYSAVTFTESTDNNGSIANTLTLTLAGTTFTGSNGDNFVSAGKVSASNVPAGLTVVATRNSSTQITLSLSGNAAAHENANDIANLTINFEDGAFSSGENLGVTNYSRNNLIVDFRDTVSIAYSDSTFNEAVTNIGVITETKTLTLSNDTWTGSNGEDYISTGKATVANVPAGMTAQLTRQSASALSFRLNGTAASHVNANDISNLTLNFTSGAFTTSTSLATITNSGRSDLNVNFLDAYVLTYDTPTFNEAIPNDGTIGNSLVLTLTGTTFTGSNGDNFIAAGKISASNIPAGLTVSAIRNSTTQITVSLSGSASNHENINDIANLTLDFEDTAFTSNEDAGVTNQLKSNIAVNFNDKPILGYSSSIFAEAASNIGVINNSITITLTAETFTGANGSSYIADSKATVTNVPAGLTATLIKDSATQLTLSLTGTATNHANAYDISNLSIVFNNSAFTNVTANLVTGSTNNTINVDYLDPYLLSFSTTTFTESTDNNGSIPTVMTVTLIGNTFTGSNGDNFISGGKITVTNLPAGLSATSSRTSTTTLTIAISGNAAAHENANDVANLTFTYQDSAFTSGESDGVTNAAKSDYVIDFRSVVSLSYSDSSLDEAVANIGTVTETSILTLTNDTLTGSNGENYVSTSKAIISNVPAGMTASLIKNSATQLTLALSGTATNHANVNDISNLTVAFDISAFTTSTSLATITNSTKNDLAVNFLDPYSLAYGSSTFTEASANNGSIGNTSTLTLTGTTFTGTNGDNFVAGGKVTVTNVPAGLTPVVTRDSTTQLTVSLTGNATSHQSANDISNLTVDFADSAFSSNEDAGVTNESKANINVDFNDAPVIAYGTSTFNEDVSNIGVVSTTSAITLTNDTFTGANGSDFVAASKAVVTNVPAGLTAVLTKDSATQLTMTLTGTATNHANANDIANLTVTFQDSAFTNVVSAALVTGYIKNNLLVNFLDPFSISYDLATFTETTDNNGTIPTALTLTLTGTTFTGSNGDNFITASKLVVTNLPAGLTAVANRDSATQITVTLTGTAVAHENANDIANLTFTFQDSAFASAEADGVTNANKNNIVIDYRSAVSIAYSNATFNEAVSNIGTISETKTLTLSNDTYTGSNGENFVATSKASVTNVPAGMTATLMKDSATQLTLSLTGTATNHANANDVANLTVTFAIGAFTTSTSLATIGNSTKNDLAVNFLDPYSIAYSGATFTEAAGNNGSISNNLTLTLTGTTFTGSNGDNFVAGGKAAVSNVPAGLTAVVNRDSATQLTVSLSGNASTHTNASDIANLTVDFADSAFASNEDAGVTNQSKNDIAVDFIDPPVLAYSVSTFTENVANIGVTSTSSVITLTIDTFTGANGSDFVAASKAVVTNVPAGFTAVLTKDSATQLTMTLTGTATNHANANDIANLTVTFQDTAFTNAASASLVTNYIKNNFVVDFLDPYTLTYSAATFTETTDNNGTIPTALTLTLAGTTFTGSNGDNFVSGGKMSVTNLPAGLTAVATRDSATQITVTLTGTAAAHENANDIANLTFTFQDSAFTSAEADGVTNANKNNIVIDYRSAVSIAYSDATFNEAVANIGTISETKTLTLSNDTFTGSNGENFVATSKASVTNVPAGMTATLVKDSATQLTLALTGTATNHANANDVANLTVTFAIGAFTTSTSLATIGNSTKNDLAVNFLDPYSIAYSGATFTEASGNNGSISNNLTLTLTGTTFTGSNGDNFVAGGKVAVSNVPTGLTVVVTRDSSSQLTVSLTGNASTHTNASDIANLTVDFADSAFASNEDAGVTNQNKNDIVVDFTDPPVLAYSVSTFNEDVANVGVTSTSSVITLTIDTFTGANGSDFVAASKAVVTNVPAGLTAVLTKDSNTQLTMTLTGTATNHANANDIANLTVTFQDTAFTNAASATLVTNYLKNNFTVNFLDPYSISYDLATFTETTDNNGTIPTTLTLTLAGTTFTGSNGDNFVAGGKMSVANLPAGLTAVATRDSATQISVTLTGTAAAHENANDIANLTFTFQDSAFASAEADGVTNANKNNIIIDYRSAVSIAYSGSTVNEASTNIGNITETLVLTLSNDSFTGANGEDYVATAKATVNNVPAGMTSTLVKNSATQLTLALTGTATNHANANDVSNLTVTFGIGAFTTSTSLATIGNSTKNDLIINFLDPYNLAYSGSMLNENTGNNGSISNTITITLTGTIFTGSNGDNFVAGSKVAVTNVPTGLTAVVNRDSSTQLTLSLTGNATSHANANDISNLTLDFADSAFASNEDAGVTNQNKNDIVVDFTDPPVLAYSVSTFNEDVANVGVTSTSSVITLTIDSFTGANGSDFVAASKAVVTNVPAGLTAVLTKDSATQLTMTLTGSATNHANANDIANLTVTFQDTAFTNASSASLVSNYLKNNFVVNFLDPYSITYDFATFTETTDNNGTIPTTLTLTLAGTTFTGSNGDNFVAGGKMSVTNLPAGLTAVATRDSATQISVTLTGTAAAHENANDIANLTFTFQDTAFASAEADGVTNANKNNIVIDYRSAVSIAYGATTYNENVKNIGTITETTTLTLSNDTYTGSNGEDYIGTGKVTVTNTPAGMTATLIKNSATQLTLSFTGTATSHENAQDIANLTLNFTTGAFTTSSSLATVTNSQRNDLIVNFTDAYTLTPDTTTLAEATANDGTIGNPIVFTLSGTTFTGSNGEAYTGNAKASVTGIPAGLTATLTKTSATVATLTITGTASNHQNANDTSAIVVTFNDTAFTSTEADGVTGAAISGVVMNFNDQASIAFSGATFTEDVTNIGQSASTITLTLSGPDTFTGSNGDNFLTTSRATVNNVPSGMVATLIRDSATQLTLSLTGSATNHENVNDVANLTVTILTAGFTNTSPNSGVTNYTKNNIVVDFANTYTLSYSASTFTEDSDNDGSIPNTLVITLAGTTFTGSDGNDFVSDGKIVVTNTPAGLTAVATRDSSTQITLTLTGNAASHENGNDIANLTVTFQNNAFNSNEKTGVTNYLKNNIAINFNSQVSLSYSATTFNENSLNVGTITQTATITLAEDTFTGSNGENFISTSKVTTSNVPSGLTVSIIKNSATQATISFTGNATNHANANDTTTIAINFTTAALTNSSNIAAVTNGERSDIGANFIDPYSISYDVATLSERVNNDGVMNNTIVLTLTGTTLTGSNSDNFIAASKAVVNNVPSGLTATLIRDSATQLTLSLTGNATVHENVNDISNLTISLLDTAFSSGEADGVTNSFRNDIAIDYRDAVVLSYNTTTLTESVANVGAIGNTFVITLSGDTLTGINGDDFIAAGKVNISNLPAGLSATLTRNSSTQLTLATTGNATNHAHANDVSNLTLTFLNTSLTLGNALYASNYNRTNLVVDFVDPYLISYSTTTFTELGTNVGAISNTFTVTLIGTTWTGVNTDDFVVDGKLTVSNLPAGLTAVATRDSSTIVTVSLTGTATNHANVNDVSNLTFTFNDNAFTSGEADGVTSASRNNLAIDFIDVVSPVIAYDTTTFIETEPNDGAFTGRAIIMTLYNDTFTGANGSNMITASKVTVTNVPAGLTAVVTKDSNTQATLTFTGNATNHAAANNIANLTITYADSAFSITPAAGVTGGTKNDLAISFLDPHTLTYSASTFSEALADTGSIGNTLTISVGGTTFTGANNDNFVAASKVTFSNVPAGLTGTATRVSATAVEIGLTGNATTHYNANDIANLTVTFANSAFTSGNASLITNYNKNNIVVDYFANPVIAPSNLLVSNTTTTTSVLTWTDNAVNETEYQIERCAGTACATTFTVAESITALAVNTVTYTFTGLTEGTYHMFRVRALHPENSSAWIMTPTTIIFGGIQSHDPGDGSFAEFSDMDCRSQVNSYAIVKWNAVAGASSYFVYDSTSGSDSLLATVGTSKNYYVVNSLSFNTLYKYKVKVVMTGTGITSVNSAVTTMTTDATFAPCSIYPTKSFVGGMTLPQHVNNPGDIAYYGGKLYILDTSNHRVLIWNSLPTAAGTEPDVVIGQEEILDGATRLGFTSSPNYNQNSGIAPTSKSLNTPRSIWVGDVGGTTKIAIADTGNHRVLIWNSVPTTSYAAANVVIGQTTLSANTLESGGRVKGLESPSGVFSDGTKLFVSDTANHRILIYNTFPTSNYPTPTTYLAATSTTDQGGSCVANDLINPRDLLTTGTKLIVADASNHRVLIWNDYTAFASGSVTTNANVVVGQANKTTCTANAGNTRMNQPYGVFYDSTGDKLYITDRDNHRVKVYSSIPAADGAASSYVLGDSNTAANTGAQADRIRNPEGGVVVIHDYTASDDMVIASDTLNHRIAFWTPTIPSAESTNANFWLGKSTFNLSNTANYLSTSSASLKSPEDVEIYGGQMFVADAANHRILVWDDTLKINGTVPDFVLGQANFTGEAASNAQNGLNSPYGLCAGDNKLFVTEYSSNKVSIFQLPITGNQPNKIAVLGQTTYVATTADATGANLGKFENPADCFYDEATDRLFVADYNNHRVLYWDTFVADFETATGGVMDGGAANQDSIVLAADYYLGVNNTVSLTQNGLNLPRGVYYDGTNIWVADTSHARILRFDLPTGNAQNATLVLGQPDFTTANTNSTTQAALRNARSVFVIGNKIYATDQTSERVVMWNNPSSDGDIMTSQAGQTDFTNLNNRESGAYIPMIDPAGMATDGLRLFIIDRGLNRVMVAPAF